MNNALNKCPEASRMDPTHLKLPLLTLGWVTGSAHSSSPFPTTGVSVTVEHGPHGSTIQEITQQGHRRTWWREKASTQSGCWDWSSKNEIAHSSWVEYLRVVRMVDFLCARIWAGFGEVHFYRMFDFFLREEIFCLSLVAVWKVKLWLPVGHLFRTHYTHSTSWCFIRHKF